VKTAVYSQLQQDLAELRRRWRGRAVWAGVLGLWACALGVLVVAALVDNLWRPGVAGRVIVAVLCVGVTAVGGLRLLARRLWENRSDDYFAALVEQRHPELRNVLINAVQLGREAGPDTPRLVGAIVQDAAGATADLDWGDCLESRTVKRAGWAAGIAVAVMAGYALLWGPQLVNGLTRVLLPLADVLPYSATQIASLTGDVRVPEGATVTLAGKVSGARPDQVRLYRRPDGKAWQVAQAQPVAEFTVAGVTESFAYYLAAGDGRSREHRVVVVKRPQVEKLALTYTPPLYTGKPAQPVPVSNGELSGLAGTMVALELTSTKPLREASLVAEGGRVIALERGGDEQTWRGTLMIWSADAKAGDAASVARLVAPTRYQTRLLDTDGYENATPVWHTVTLVKDQPPTVTIVTPGRDTQVRPDEAVKLVVAAADDYGIGTGQIMYRVNDEPAARELAAFTESPFEFVWQPGATGLKAGDLAQYWAVVTDRNNITGPGRAESRRFSLLVVAPQQAVKMAETQITDYAQVLEELLRMQRENRAQTVAGVAFETVAGRQGKIRELTGRLARAMERGAAPLATLVTELDELRAGLMAEAVRLLEQQQREAAVPVQERIIAVLGEMLARLQRNEQARTALRKLEKTDKPAHGKIAEALGQMLQELDRMLGEDQAVAGKFEKMPKRPVDEENEESADKLKEFEQAQRKWKEWAAGKVDELAKLPAGFVDDFGLRADVKRIVEEIEQAAERRKAVDLDVAIEDIGDPTGKGIPTKMKEDLEMWMPDTPDYVRWRLEEPFVKMDVAEMPLPDVLEDMMGDLLQDQEEFDEEADDLTSAWGVNLDQAGWLVVDGNESSFSAKGKTGNDIPNSNELTGRSGDGRRGKSSGQMVGDTSRALEGRDTPARVGAERYEPGALKQEAQDDPRGATGGGKKAGAGQRGLQGGTPPDFVKDMQRLSEKQQVIREEAEKVAQRLEAAGASSRRLGESIELMKSIEQDYRDLRYTDAARRRRVALSKLDGAVTDPADRTGVQLSRARELPAALREELLQASDEGYPAGYETMLKSYFRALAEGEQ